LFDESKAAGDMYILICTPIFVFNGKTTDAHSWEELQKLLDS
jgi:hypothetical protein